MLIRYYWFNWFFPNGSDFRLARHQGNMPHLPELYAQPESYMLNLEAIRPNTTQSYMLDLKATCLTPGAICST